MGISSSPLLLLGSDVKRKRLPSFLRRKHTGKVIAIRREDQSVWERRAPLAPANVYQLKKKGVTVLVQPSNRRAYPVQAYIKSGAVVKEDISEASIIFGVKQAPIDLLMSNKTYCFFSHTIKAQESNMPLLDAILHKNIRLIDYEKLVDESGNRVVAFGKYAGVAGMVNILHGLGVRLLALGHHTPFMHVGPAHNYRNSMMARQALRDAGYEIALGMMPKSIGPLTFVFTGSGNVSQGAQEIFQELPHEYVPPEMLQKVAEHGSTTKLYGCVVGRRQYTERIEGGGYNREEFEQYPHLYKSTFSKKIAPFVSVLINGIYWAVDAPKLLTVPDAKTLLRPFDMPWLPTSEGAPRLPHRMLAICDISADPGGSIEFMNECTTLDNPFCLYDADRHKDTNSFKGPGVLVCSIDNMPTQLPTEATDFFGNLMMPYALDILQSDATKPLEDHNFITSVYDAIIASNGKLTPNFEYIQELRSSSSQSHHKTNLTNENMRKILVLGAGHVCDPFIEYLHRDESVFITLGSLLEGDAKVIASNYSRVESVVIDVQESKNYLETLISNSEIVVSLLPYHLHHSVAELCINNGVNMVTASYCNENMWQLNQKALEAGVTIVNEVGLDPGIDHLLAMECFDQVHEVGGKIESFVSYCGGLPAPEFSNNPLRYKFSWLPRAVLLNTISSAKYLRDSEEIKILPGGQLMDHAVQLDFLPGFAFEGFPNRDSIKYANLYGIEAEAHTILRGSIRYKGFVNIMKGLQILGLIDPNHHPALHPKGPDITWRQLICTLLGLQSSDIFYENLKTKISDKVGNECLAGIEQLGLLEDEFVLKLNSPLDTISDYLRGKLSLSSQERDLIVLHHDITIGWPIGRKERKTITLVEYGGLDSKTAMARLVGLPAAIAANMLLNGEIQSKGMILPLTPDIYRPMLARLRLEGLNVMETVSSI